MPFNASLQPCILQSLEPWVAAELLPRCGPYSSTAHAAAAAAAGAAAAPHAPSQTRWAPSDLLPAPASASFPSDLAALREAALKLPNDLLVVAAGAAVCAEAGPALLSAFNSCGAIGDATGAQGHAYAR